MVMLSPDKSVWLDGTVRDRLSWYYAVMQNRKPAKFLICKSIPCDIDIESASEEELWQEHDRLSHCFYSVLGEIATSEQKLSESKCPFSFLDLKVALLNRMLNHCNFCEWNCKVNRISGIRREACRMNATTTVATWFRHFGEEAPLVGEFGSGTIFFAGCTLRCVHCQNWDISQHPQNGAPVDGRKLASIMRDLRNEGAHNINFVGGEPTPNLHTIVDGMRHLETNIAMLWNSNMYASLHAMKILVDVIDIWLPDFKYGNNECALRISKVVRYFSTVARNHKIAYDNGDMIIRHLVLPSHIECCTKPILNWIAKYCPRALVNIMNQYHPDYRIPGEPERYKDIARLLTREEIVASYKHARELGIIYEPVS
jgi:putative pyruvate formate lyase activating enzyme